MHSIIERHYLLLRVYIVLLFLKGNNIQYHLYQIPLKLNVYIRYVFWAGGLALRNKVMLCYVMSGCKTEILKLSTYFRLSKSLESLPVNGVMKNLLIVYVKTKAQISCAVTPKLISALVFAT